MEIESKPHEECAVFGVSVRNHKSAGNAAGIVYNGLLSLQHRGQEGAGIAVVSGNEIQCYKDTGLVSEVFENTTLERFPESFTAIGHTRYSTTGYNTKENLGPFVSDYLTGRIAAAHNGNITNAKKIRQMLQGQGVNFYATSDSEVISHLIAYCIMKEDSLNGTIRAAKNLKGAFSLVILCGDNKLIAVRDPDGYRPLCIGKNESGIAVASESCALDGCDFEFTRDVMPGEIIVIENGEITYQGIELRKKNKNSGLCIFEYVYFARPDSVIDGLSVYEARYNMGVALADEHHADADVVCGVPDSGLEAAAGYSARSGIPLVSGFVKNKYIGRSFIYPTQSQRESAVRLKLNPLAANVKDKRIVLVDDSIVRGTTNARIVRSLKNAGAKEVHLRISSPPFRFACHYGTDIDSEENLIANKMGIGDICTKIGADSLGYIGIENLYKSCSKCGVSFCSNCFTGNSLNKKIQKNQKNDLE